MAGVGHLVAVNYHSSRSTLFGKDITHLPVATQTVSLFSSSWIDTGSGIIRASSRPMTTDISRRFLRVHASPRGQELTSVRSVPVRVAHELLNAGHRYLDVRTQEEFAAGHPEGAINIPYMLKAGSGMAKNPRFLQEVSEHFDRDAEVVVGCQSGRRSIMAATELQATEFTGVTDMVGGYVAWVQSELPVAVRS